MKIALMFSGGLDSTVAYFWAMRQGLDVQPIWVDLGQPYAIKEEMAMERVGITPTVFRLPIMRAPGYVGEWGGWIVPGRNLLLATIGANFGDEVWLCALLGEMHRAPYNPDKSPEFFDLTTGLLTFVYSMSRDRTRVTTPFADKTKSDVVRLALEIGMTPELIKATSSCYSHDDGNCGECGTCFKRWVALTNNGLEETYRVDPWTSEYAEHEIEAIRDALDRNDFTHYNESRCLDTMNALTAGT